MTDPRTCSIPELVAMANAQNRREREQAPAPLHPCRFAFDEGPVFDGFTDDTTWNGWANVWVNEATLARLVSMFESWQDGQPLSDEEMSDFVMHDHGPLGALASLNGLTPHIVTSECEDDHKEGA